MSIVQHVLTGAQITEITAYISYLMLQNHNLT